MNHTYDTTVHGVMAWANSELEHVGRIASIRDAQIQYNYAQSTIFGMAHLRDALFQMVNNPAYKNQKSDLLKTHNAVIRVMKHLIKDYNINLNSVRSFNSGHVLSNLSYLNNSKASKNNSMTRKLKK
jgi:hypothetical protein